MPIASTSPGTTTSLSFTFNCDSIFSHFHFAFSCFCLFCTLVFAYVLMILLCCTLSCPYHFCRDIPVCQMIDLFIKIRLKTCRNFYDAAVTAIVVPLLISWLGKLHNQRVCLASILCRDSDCYPLHFHLDRKDRSQFFDNLVNLI